MDESSFYTPQVFPILRRRSSQPTLRSDGTSHRPHSPHVRPSSSFPTYASPDGDSPSANEIADFFSAQRNPYPEIVAPVPLRHHALQLTPDAWIRTPSPSSSRAISPSTSMTPVRGGFVRGSGRHYRYASFGSAMGAGEGPGAPLREEEQGFGRRWLRWMHKNGVKHWVVPCTLIASALVRWCIGLGSYSGAL